MLEEAQRLGSIGHLRKLSRTVLLIENTWRAFELAAAGVVWDNSRLQRYLFSVHFCFYINNKSVEEMN